MNSIFLKFFLKTIFLFVIFISFFEINSHAVYCNNLDFRNGNPADLIECITPSDIPVKPGGRGIFDIIMLINNVLAILAVFLSIIGVIVGTINLAQAKEDKKSYAEAKTMISNSFLAFFLVACLWLIVSLVLNSLGAGGLVPIIRN